MKETTAMSAFRCEQVDSQRCHVFPITDLASTSTLSSESKEVSLWCNSIIKPITVLLVYECKFSKINVICRFWFPAMKVGKLTFGVLPINAYKSSNVLNHQVVPVEV